MLGEVIDRESELGKWFRADALTQLLRQYPNDPPDLVDLNGHCRGHHVTAPIMKDPHAVKFRLEQEFYARMMRENVKLLNDCVVSVQGVLHKCDIHPA